MQRQQDARVEAVDARGDRPTPDLPRVRPYMQV